MFMFDVDYVLTLHDCHGVRLEFVWSSSGVRLEFVDSHKGAAWIF